MIPGSPFVGLAKRLADADLIAAAGQIGCELAVLRAVMAVESAGKGFDSSGRPVILFEPHVFYRNLVPSLRGQAVACRLASAVWNPKLYAPAGDARWDQVDRARAINQEAACRAVSWGLGQVLGENYHRCGFPSAVAMGTAMAKGEAEQLGAMVAFIMTGNLGPALRAKNWRAFAVAYNGPGQVDDYAARLQAAYHPDTAPARPTTVKVTTTVTTEVTADDLNAQQLAAIRSGATGTAEDLNAAELARIRAGK